MSLLSTIGKGLVGFATGGPAGAALGIASSFMPGRPSAPPAPQMPFGVGAGITAGNYQIGGEVGIFRGAKVGINFGPSTGPNVTPGGGGACPRGYHLNKHALPASRSHGAVPPRSICVRNRHMNALNGRAAGRALRRLKRADKMTRKIHSIFHRPQRRLTSGRKR